MLFFGIICDNILYGKVDVLEVEIVEVVKVVNVYMFISGLFYGYDINMGD